MIGEEQTHRESFYLLRALLQHLPCPALVLVASTTVHSPPAQGGHASYLQSDLQKPVGILFAGVIPASFTDQLAAQRLAVCNDIGEASYVDSLIAASMLDTFTALPAAHLLRRKLEQRYDVEFSEDMTGAYLKLHAMRKSLRKCWISRRGL